MRKSLLAAILGAALVLAPIVASAAPPNPYGPPPPQGAQNVYAQVAMSSACASANPANCTVGNATGTGNVVGAYVGPFSGVGVQVTGTYTGTLQFEVSNDGVNFSAINMFPLNSTTGQTTTTGTGIFTANIAGFTFFQVRMTAYTSGTATVTLNTSTGVAASSKTSAGGGGNTLSSPNSTITIGGTSTASSIDLNLTGITNNTCIGTGTTALAAPSSSCALVGSANTFTTGQTIQGVSPIGTGSVASTCATAVATLVGICTPANQGTTNTVGLALGPQQSTWSCTTSCTAGNSTQISLCRSTATGPDCSGQIIYTSGGSLQLSPTGSVITNNKNFSAGTGSVTLGKLIQNANGDVAGTCTMSAATTCNVTWTYTPTFCVAGATQATPTAIAAATSISGTTVTITAASSNSEVWSLICV